MEKCRSISVKLLSQKHRCKVDLVILQIVNLQRNIYKIHQQFNMAGKTYEDFLPLGINSFKSNLNVPSVATPRYSTGNQMRVGFQIPRLIFQLFCHVQNKNSLLLKINCKVIAFMTAATLRNYGLLFRIMGKY